MNLVLFPNLCFLALYDSAKHDLARPCASEMAPPDGSARYARDLPGTAVEAGARVGFLEEEEENSEDALKGDKVT